MNRSEKKAQRIKTVLFMLAITFIFISVLSLVYVLTQDRVRANESLYLKRAVLFTGGISNEGPGEKVEEIFKANVREIKTGEGRLRYFAVMSDESPAASVKGYVFIRNGSGLWGTVTALVGISADGKTITGVDFIKDNETPGLGARINESWFKEQFRGKSGPFSMVGEKESAGDSEFQAITGATITSTAVKTIINKTLESAPEEIEK